MLFGKPWIFSEINGNTNINILETILEHIKLEVEYKGEYVGIRNLRKHMHYYIKGLKGNAEIKEKINKIETKKELEECLIEYMKKL